MVGSPPAPISSSAAERRLAALTHRARREMQLIGHNHDWVPDPGEGVFNVIIIGGGQAGLGAAFSLKRQRITKVKILEASDDQTVGCWARYARMHTLRSPKNMKGIELDIPSLHTEQWFRARYGDAAWDATTLVPRLDWHEYLRWYRMVTMADVDYNTSVLDVLPPKTAGGPFTIRTSKGDYSAMRVVFALGLDGGGGPFVPPLIKSLPPSRWAHTEQEIDFSQLRGKNILVIGGGASGFDNAGAALEAGANQVDLVLRSPEVARQNSLRWMEFPGMQEHFFDLSDDRKWEFGLFNGGLPQPPTQASVWRAFSFKNFSVTPRTTVLDVTVPRDPATGEHLPSSPMSVRDNHGTTRLVDFIISATGYTVDLSLRPEMTSTLEHIALWTDRYPAAKGHPLGKCPYLGDGFQFTPKASSSTAGELEWVSRLYHFSTGARASHGVAGNQLSGIYAGLTRLSNRIAKDITADNWDQFFSEFKAFENEEVYSVGPHTPDDPSYPSKPSY